MTDQNYIFNTELGQKLLVLTKAGFVISNQITDLIMRDKIKGKLLDIYETFGSSQKSADILKEIDILDNLLHLSSHLGLTPDEHIKKLRNGYLVFKSHIVLSQQPHRASSNIRQAQETDAPADDLKKEMIRSDVVFPLNKRINERHEAILSFLKNQGGQVRLSDLIKLFPKLSEKSIRNDLSQLCADGKLKRNGWGPTSYYSLR